MLAIIAGLAGVTNFVMVRVSEYVTSITGTPISDGDIIDILLAILSHLIKTGENVTDVVIDNYVTTFQHWTVLSTIAVAIVGVAVYLFYKGGDEVPFEATETFVKSEDEED